MSIAKLAHYSIRSTRLEASRKFYVEVLGLREGFRPPFDFPGHWLYRGGDEAEFGVVHLIGIDKDDPQGLDDYLGAKGEETLYGSAAVDHLAFLATNLPDMHRRLDQAGCVFRERTVPSLGLHQVFVEDPSGVTIELNYPSHEATRA
ncbi:VOC family protein [Variovorax sp. dw_308]|uniref:VOC family protein n=1 Tax=Variovorax sp. dw_308 TaxID=2721546 RepID=UPI001C4592D7|nr:VOC family protein [Variovorax sp. dw_308]